MQIIRKNLYKQYDIFKCVHEVHLHFKSHMSPYHIMIEKKCYPHGCIYFQWKCKILAKQHKCFRNFTHVGKECFNCRYFHEEKIHQYPEFLQQNTKPDEYIEAFEEFHEWVHLLKGKRVLCEGTVGEVKPDFILKKNQNNYTLLLRGYMICFEEGYLDNQFFQDKFYLSISAKTQSQLLIRPDDIIEFEANLFLDRGRFKFIKSSKFHLMQRGAADSRIKYDSVVQKTFTVHLQQPAQCLNCKHGILVDIETKDPGPHRTVICLQGVPDHKDCPICSLQTILDQNDHCANSAWNELRCRHLL
jgi:hypothetical protein